VPQLAKPLIVLAAAAPGEHVITVSVTPDNLGPVTVRAHVGADGMRIEMFAPNDAGRDALRTIMADLRRDLASAGQGGASLDLSSQNQPSRDEQRQQGRATPATPNAPVAPAVASPATIHQQGRTAGTASIDVLA
jgi:flagellar hook-length control protein FliK